MLDCVVVGAGIAGLQAALRLDDAGRDFVILEARGRVGGRIENVTLDDGQIAEHGGQWINPGHEQMLALVDGYGLKHVPPTGGDILVVSKGNVNRMAAEAREPAYSPFEMSDLGQGLARFSRLSQRATAADSWSDEHATWLNQHLVRWINANLRTPGARGAFRRVLVDAIGEVNFDTMTLGEALDAVEGGLGLESLVAISGSLQQIRVDGGIFQICEGMAEKLADRIKLDSPVASIEQAENGVTVTTRDGDVYRAAQVIVTVPPWLVPEITFSPALPEWRSEVLAKSSAGSIFKIHLIYPEPWWRADGLSGQMGADVGPVRVTLDTSNNGGGYGLLMGFFEGPDADRLRASSPEMREHAFIHALKRAFGEKAGTAIAYVERDWFAEEFTRGCHVPHFTPGHWSLNGAMLAEAEGRVHFAGAEYASKFNSYMEGALISAGKAVDEVLAAL